jgi:hypothetical protein
MKKVLIVVILFTFGSCLFAQDYEIGDHELLLMPTATTIPKGTSYFSDYELIFLNYTLGVTDRTSISAYSLFPIVDSFLETFTLSAKHNYYRSSKVSSALWLTTVLDNPYYAIGNVISIEMSNTSLHIGMAGLGDNDSDNWGYLVMLGSKTKISEKADFILEYENTGSGIENDFNGLLSLGFRFRSNTIAWDIAGMRSLTDEDTDDELQFIPYLKATVFFE